MDEISPLHRLLHIQVYMSDAHRKVFSNMK